MARIKDYLIDLNWNNSVEIQKKSIHEIVSNDEIDISSLIQPIIGIHGKDYWHNCAIVIYKLGYNKWKKYSSRLLEWLQDMNWPGADIIYNMYLNTNYDYVKDDIDNAIKTAKESDDETWASNLISLENKEPWQVNDVFDTFKE